MKRILVAILIGLPIGFVLSLAIRQPDENAEPIAPQKYLEIPRPTHIPAPRPTLARKGASLAQQRIEARYGRQFSPYRDELISIDLIHSMGAEQLVEVFLAGELQSQAELASAFATITRSDPVRALELVDNIAQLGVRNGVLRKVFDTWLTSDPQGLITYLDSQPDGEFGSALSNAWAAHDPAGAMAYLNGLQTEGKASRHISATDTLEIWADSDFEAGERWIRENANPEMRERWLGSLLNARLRWGGEKDVDFLIGRGDENSLAQLPVPFLKWVHKEPEPAIDRFVTMPASYSTWTVVKPMGYNAAEGLFHGNHEVGILSLQEKFPEGESRRQFLLGAADYFTGRDSDRAAEIITALPESPERIEAVSEFADRWARHDPPALAEWIHTLEPSPSRDRAIAIFVTRVAESDPVSARELAAEIADEAERQRIIDGVFAPKE